MCLCSTDIGFSSRQLRSLKGPEVKTVSLAKAVIRMCRTVSSTFIYLFFLMLVFFFGVGFSQVTILIFLGGIAHVIYISVSIKVRNISVRKFKQSVLFSFLSL